MYFRHLKKIIFLFSVLAFTLVGFQTAEAVKLPVIGWAWSSNVGWISLSSKNVGAGIGGTYGVDVDSLSGAFSGHAWSPHVGWVSFNAIDSTGCNGSCPPGLNPVTGNVAGFLKILTGKGRTDGWDGFIRLSGVNHLTGNPAGTAGVTYNPTRKTFNGYAWAPYVGWVDFNGVRLESALPDVPTNLTPSISCNAGNFSLTLNWSTAPGATSYSLRDGTSAIYTGSSTTFTYPQNLVTGSTHSYTVSAVNASGASAYSSPAVVVKVDCNLPDLTASATTPNTATVNVAQTYSSTIKNIGVIPASGTINHTFEFDEDIDHTSGPFPVTTSIAQSTSPITVNGNVVVTNSHTFTTSGTKYMRVCADKNASSVGTVTELNEGNNCGPWMGVVVGLSTVPRIAGKASCTASASNVKLNWEVDANDSKLRGYRIYRVGNGEELVSGMVLIATIADKNKNNFTDTISSDPTLLLSHGYVLGVLFENSTGGISQRLSNKFFVPGCGKTVISLTTGPNVVVTKGQPAVISSNIISRLTSGLASHAFYSFDLYKDTPNNAPFKDSNLMIKDIGGTPKSGISLSTDYGNNNVPPTFSSRTNNLTLSIRGLETLNVDNDYRIKINATTSLDEKLSVTCVTEYEPFFFSSLSCSNSNYSEFDYEVIIGSQSAISFYNKIPFIKTAQAQIISQPSSGDISKDPWKSAVEAYANTICNAASSGSNVGNWEPTTFTSGATSHSFNCIDKTKAIANASVSFGVDVQAGNTGTCSDHIMNGDETDIDTGGRCGPAGFGTCSDGIRNGNETGVDTGGRCGPIGSGTCSDGIRNGNETGIDTGGRCDINTGTCSDGVRNGNETGVDTGGRCGKKIPVFIED